METFIRECGIEELDKGMELFYIKMEDIIEVIGRTTNIMAEEFSKLVEMLIL